MKFSFLLMLVFPVAHANIEWYSDISIKGIGAMTQCENKCALVFGTKDKIELSMWSRTSTCQQGCRFYSLTEVVDFLGSSDKDINKLCHDTCRDAHILLPNRRACQKGCQEMALLVPATRSDTKDSEILDLFGFGARFLDTFRSFELGDIAKTEILINDNEKSVREEDSVFGDDIIMDSSTNDNDVIGGGPYLAHQPIARVWIRTMPISIGRLSMLRQVPSEIDGDFQVEEVKIQTTPWTWTSCLSGRSGLPDWALVLLLAGAFVYLAYLGGQVFCSGGNRSKQVVDAVYISDLRRKQRASDLNYLLKLRAEDTDAEFIKKPPMSTV